MKPLKPKTCATDSLLLAARLRIPSAGPTCSMYIEAVTRCHIAGLIKKYASAPTHTFFLKVCYCPRHKQKGLELRAPCLGPLSSGDQDEKMLYRHRSKVGWGGVSCAAHAYLTSVRTNAAQNPHGSSHDPQPAPPAPTQVSQYWGSRARAQSHDNRLIWQAGWFRASHQSLHTPQSGHVSQKLGARSKKQAHEEGSSSHSTPRVRARRTASMPTPNAISEAKILEELIAAEQKD